MLSFLQNQNSSRNMTGRSRCMARAGGALNSQPHHTHALAKQKTLFSCRGSEISFHLHPFKETVSESWNLFGDAARAGIKRVPCLYRLAFEIISPGSVLDWFSVSGQVWPALARCILGTAVVVDRGTSSSLTSWHLSGMALCIFFSLIGSVFCYHSSHSAVFGFWLKAGGVKFVNAPGFPCRFCAFVSTFIPLPLTYSRFVDGTIFVFLIHVCWH